LFVRIPVVDAFEIEQAELATIIEIRKAVETFNTWANFYQRKDYRNHYKLAHPRIKKWKDKKKWHKWMKTNYRKIGPLESYEIVAVAPVTPGVIPCTEMGHCYRRGMQVVMIILTSRYGKIDKPLKEYAVKTNSQQGWRFGGGTFLNRPFGETMLILDRKDERRYAFKGVETVN
jgi:hypothetical protein